MATRRRLFDGWDRNALRRFRLGRICDNPTMPRLKRTRSTLALLALVAIVGGCGSAASSPPSAGASPSLAASPSIVVTPTPEITPQPTPTPTPSVAIVPVADFRTTATTVDQAGVAAILAGTNKQFKALELLSGEADGILAALQLSGTSAGTRLVLAPTLIALDTDLDAGTSRLGLIQASEVGPSIRAINWAGKSLFGESRVKTLAEWPLQANVGAATTTVEYNPSQAWTVAAAGDVNLDRGVYNEIHNLGKGADYPFDGGSVQITGHTCCSPVYGWPLPKTKRLSSDTLVRNMMSGADLSMANLEGPAPVSSSYHTSGLLFTFNQSYLSGLKNAGIDVVSLANNHVGNAGRQGMRETTAALDKIGIAHAGLGANDTAARAPAIFTIQGVRVAFLAYDSIAPSYWASATAEGSAKLASDQTVSDIQAAKAAGAQVVIVYPHWGVEYHTTPTSFERTWAHRMIDAGADIIIGNHVHYVAAMEVYKGKPIWYALGNFVFDQNWSELTEEGLILELSFSGGTLVQAWMHPILDLANCQPNLLDAASGQVVLNRLYAATGKMTSW